MITSSEKKPCPWCYYARDKKGVAGVYCTGGFENPDGTCSHYLDYLAEKKRRRKEKNG